MSDFDAGFFFGLAQGFLIAAMGVCVYQWARYRP